MTNSAEPPNLSTIDELADRFDVTRETVLRWNSSGTAPRRISIGKRVYYRETDIQEWIDAQVAK
ncbi:MAG: DNA-binding protein [Marmoricola sp.]|nr:DNA-binding protein [Marmoricola sp.]